MDVSGLQGEESIWEIEKLFAKIRKLLEGTLSTWIVFDRSIPVVTPLLLHHTHALFKGWDLGEVFAG